MQDFILAHRRDDVAQLALQHSKYQSFTDEEWRWILQQIEGWQRTKSKLPSVAKMQDWWYPVRLSCEQCSSETTAQYKHHIVQKWGCKKMVDLTGGTGIDTWFISKGMEKIEYVEQNEELCRIAKHNFALLQQDVIIHHSTAEDIIKQGNWDKDTLAFIDPARRDKDGKKVFRLEDCTPNVPDIIDEMKAKFGHILIKLSPMLDFHEAIQSLGGAWDCHIVGYKNEVKELLLADGTGEITAIDLADNQAISFSLQEEKESTVRYCEQIGQYLYEPNVSLMKAGAYKWLSMKYGIEKLDANTHLYTSDKLVEGWPGKRFNVLKEPVEKKGTYNIITRNYVMGAEELKKKLKVHDGGEKYIIGTRVRGKNTLVVAQIIL